jgi:hypothetical protein
MQNGDVDPTMFCGIDGKTIDEDGKPIVCGGAICAWWFASRMEEDYILRTECLKCHVRVYHRISAVEAPVEEKKDDKDDSIVHRGGAFSVHPTGTECPRCRIHVKELWMMRGQMVCSSCYADCYSVYDNQDRSHQVC